MTSDYNTQHTAAGGLFSPLRQTWVALAVFFAKTARVPNSEDAFTQRYGVFPDPVGVADFVAINIAFNQYTAKLGNPAMLKQSVAANPAYLQGTQMPADIYAALVWLATQSNGAAGSFSSTFSNLSMVLHPGMGSDEERAETVKQLLTGSHGLVPPAVAIKAHTMAFLEQLAVIQTGMQANYEILAQTQLLNYANQTIGMLNAQLKNLTPELEKAKKEAETALIDKEKKRERYRTLQAQFDSLQAQCAAKQLFVNDMDNIFLAANQAVMALLNVKSNVEKLGKVFADARTLLMSLCTSASTEQLASLDWLNRALGLPNAIVQWQALGADAQQFSQQALISTS